MVPEQGGYTRTELQTFARSQHGIKVLEEKQRVIGGWQGKPKGLLQVLWETRGLILEGSLVKYYSSLDTRRKDATIKDTHIDLQPILTLPLAETALQYLGTQLGVSAELMMPKLHPEELAGEGIEYCCWVHAKSFYQLVPVCQKQGQENFKELAVRE
jgi:hypothetical protein